MSADRYGPYTRHRIYIFNNVFHMPRVVFVGKQYEKGDRRGGIESEAETNTEECGVEGDNGESRGSGETCL